MAIIEIKNFCKAYDQLVAVRELSLDVEAGQIVGLVGPNGAGKTTTLRAINGIIPHCGGSIRIAGFDLATQPLLVKRFTAYVPDDPQLFHDLTVADHLAFVASAYQVTDAEKKANRLLDEFGLAPKRHANASELSRGMRQKLALCCAYLFEPLALLLDEPMTGLDPPGIRQLKDSILQRAQNGAAVMISSHLLAMVEDICTDVLILCDGKRQFFGPLSVLRNQYGKEDDSSLERIFFRAIEAPESTDFGGMESTPDNDATPFAAPSLS